MKINVITIFLAVFIFKSHTSDYENTENYRNYSEAIDIDEFNETYYEDDYDIDHKSEVCSVDTVINDLSDQLLPQDYEEGKKLDINRKLKHINETIDTIKRLHQYYNNVSKKMEPIIKRIIPRISDILLSIDLPPDCMASLAMIGQSAQNREQWALKCKP
jgi:archaellum component FlaC